MGLGPPRVELAPRHGVQVQPPQVLHLSQVTSKGCQLVAAGVQRDHTPILSTNRQPSLNAGLARYPAANSARGEGPGSQGHDARICRMCHLPPAMSPCATCHLPCHRVPPATCHVTMSPCATCHLPCHRVPPATCHVTMSPCATCHLPCHHVTMCHLPPAMSPCATCRAQPPNAASHESPHTELPQVTHYRMILLTRYQPFAFSTLRDDQQSIA
jgi:hypothetical protein